MMSWLWGRATQAWPSSVVQLPLRCHKVRKRQAYEHEDQAEGAGTEHVNCPFVLHVNKKKRHAGERDTEVTITAVTNQHSLVFVEKDKHRKRNTSTVSQDFLRPLVQAYMQTTENKATAHQIARHLQDKFGLDVTYHTVTR
jgi:hypothetical protein